jgi:polyhydroxybutyrate depolymerase
MSISGRTARAASAAIVFVTALAGVSLVAVPSGRTVAGSITVDGRVRTYFLHVPPQSDSSRPLPLVLAFHGGGGQARSMVALARFDTIADREGFLVAYPDGVKRGWNDGRGGAADVRERGDVDDVAFVAALLDAIAKEHAVDVRRVFATGMSNGAIFSNLLAVRLAPRLAAIAPVAGGLAAPLEANFAPARPVSVLVISGTQDPLVPYAGGFVINERRGSVVGAERTARLWATRDGCAAEPRTARLPDTDPNDGCFARETTWGGGTNGTEVTLLTIEGGGHTWPGGSQYLPRLIIGRVCRDFDASERIWAFFAAHPKPESTPPPARM